MINIIKAIYITNQKLEQWDFIKNHYKFQQYNFTIELSNLRPLFSVHINLKAQRLQTSMILLRNKRQDFRHQIRSTFLQEYFSERRKMITLPLENQQTYQTIAKQLSSPKNPQRSSSNKKFQNYNFKNIHQSRQISLQKQKGLKITKFESPKVQVFYQPMVNQNNDEVENAANINYQFQNNQILQKNNFRSFIESDQNYCFNLQILPISYIEHQNSSYNLNLQKIMFQNILSNEKILQNPNYQNPYLKYIEPKMNELKQGNQFLKLQKNLSNGYDQNRLKQYQTRLSCHSKQLQQIKQGTRHNASNLLRPKQLNFEKKDEKQRQNNQSKINKFDNQNPKQSQCKQSYHQLYIRDESKYRNKLGKKLQVKPFKEIKITKQKNEVQQQNLQKNKQKFHDYKTPKHQKEIPIDTQQIQRSLHEIIKPYDYIAKPLHDIAKKLYDIAHPLHVIVKPQYDILKKHKNFIIYDKLIGKGSYGAVYLGVNLENGTEIAVKKVQIRRKSDMQQIQCLKYIQHQNIVRLFQYFEENNYKQNKIFNNKDHKIYNQEDKKICYMIFEYCEENLKQRLQRLKRQTREDVDQVKIKISYAKQLIQGMKALHQNGIIHRDLKLQNILIKDQTIKIADFGLARKVNHNLQLQSIRCGTPYTMPPEIYFHSKSPEHKPTYTFKSDIFSLAVILDILIYQYHPFDYATDKLLSLQRTKIQQRKSIRQKIQFIENVSVEWIQQIISKGLKKESERLTHQQMFQIYRKATKQIQEKQKPIQLKQRMMNFFSFYDYDKKQNEAKHVLSRYKNQEAQFKDKKKDINKREKSVKDISQHKQKTYRKYQNKKVQQKLNVKEQNRKILNAEVNPSNKRIHKNELGTQKISKRQNQTSQVKMSPGLQNRYKKNEKGKNDKKDVSVNNEQKRVSQQKSDIRQVIEGSQYCGLSTQHCGLNTQMPVKYSKQTNKNNSGQQISIGKLLKFFFILVLFVSVTFLGLGCFAHKNRQLEQSLVEQKVIQLYSRQGQLNHNY